MAMRPMIYVWSTPYSGSKKLMLLAIADNAHEDSGICFPGVETLAAKCGIKVRAAQALITELEKAGEIVVFVGKGTKTTHGWTNLYYMQGYRQTIGLSTPAASTRIEQITPKVQGMQEPASLKEGVQRSASQGMNHPASQGMQKPASKPLDKPLVKPKEKESSAKNLLDQKPTDSPIGDSLSGDDPAIRGAALLEDAFAVKADDSDSKPTEPKSREPVLPVPVVIAPPALPSVPDPRPRNAMYDAMGYAFDDASSGLKGRISSFFAATLKDEPQLRAWFQVQPKETPATPQEVVALALWYSKHPDYHKSYAEKNGLPKTPALLRERLDEFRGAKGYSKAMELATPTLERLLKGEKLRPVITPSSAPDANTTGRVESAGAYKPYSSSTDSAYAVSNNPDEEIDLDELIGAAQ